MSGPRIAPVTVTPPLDYCKHGYCETEHCRTCEIMGVCKACPDGGHPIALRGRWDEPRR